MNKMEEYNARRNYIVLPYIIYSRAWSDRRGMIPQPSAWKADALPIELLSHVGTAYGNRTRAYRMGICHTTIIRTLHNELSAS